MLQDQLEDYMDVNVANAEKIDPNDLLEEIFDYLIIGDIINKDIADLEIQNWLLGFWELSNKKEFTLYGISGYYLASSEMQNQPLWVDFLQDNIKAEIIYPPILRLKIYSEELTLETGAFELIQEYCNDLIEFTIYQRKSKNK